MNHYSNKQLLIYLLQLSKIFLFLLIPNSPFTAKAINEAQKVNARERAAMRRDIQKEQALAVGVVGKNVGYLKSEIDLLSERESKRNGK